MQQAVRAKIDLAKGSPKDSPAAKRRGELLAQLKEIQAQQGTGKAGRSQTFEKIKRAEEQLKELIAGQKVARSRVSHKNVAEVDAEIASLDKQIETGLMKMVDEKKALAQISNLRKQRKNFGGFDETQKAIDSKKTELKQLRDTLDDPESKALSEKYNKIQGELDVTKAEQDEAYKSINSLHTERKKLQEQQQEKWDAKQKLKDDYYHAKRAVDNYEYKARQAIRERKKAEQENYVKEKKRTRAQEMLADASEKAYLDEIRTAETVLRFLDPKYQGTEKAPLQAPSKFSAQASRTIDDAGIKGMKVVRKEEEDYFAGSGGKKGKKGKKNNAAATPESPAVGKYNCPPQVMTDCATMGIDPPMSAADIPSVTEKVRAKLDFYKSDQQAQTERVSPFPL
jgi:chromosome segregation ATPase